MRPQRASEHDPAMQIAIRSLTRLLVLLPTVMLAACGSGDDGPDAMFADAPPAQEFVVGFGETIRVAGLSLEFTTLAEEEKKIRENPAARTTDLLRKVFGQQ